jgi:hypothetical protein
MKKNTKKPEIIYLFFKWRKKSEQVTKVWNPLKNKMKMKFKKLKQLELSTKQTTRLGIVF